MSISKYINYKKYSIRYDHEKNTFDVFYDGMGKIISDIKIVSVISKREPHCFPRDYGAPKATVSGRRFDNASLTVTWPVLSDDRQDFSINFAIDDHGITILMGGEATMSVLLTGHLHWGMHSQQETMAVNLDDSSSLILRSAYGPAAGARDKALFDRDTDSALKFDTIGKFSMQYDWSRDAYAFTYSTDGLAIWPNLHISVEKHIYERRFDVDYKKLNPNSTFKTPAVGWMTWYAVQFDACEKAVLENAEWQAKHLKDYGADTIWVDWEWCHRDHSSVGPEDIDMFHPDPVAYPNGLKYVADKIRELGFIPALWVSPTCDTRKNEMMEMYPDSVLVKKPTWSGQYYFDPTNPDFIETILPKMLGQVSEWGYEAVKWDVLPNTIMVCDECHDKKYRPELSTREAMLGIYKKAREVLGENCYMLSCSGSTKRDMDLASCVFDAARIGGDVFQWDEFIKFCVDRVYVYYPLHAVVCNNDPDNVVLREKFNTYDQAVTRAAIVSLLGMPFTLGDHLPDLPEDRVEIIKRSIPPVPAHPMDIRSAVSDHKNMVINLAIERECMRYNVLDVVNLRNEPCSNYIDLRADVNLDTDEKSYYVYDYWNKQFLGEVKDGFRVDLRAGASRIFAIHAVENKPQLISTSRHISQGALDIIEVRFDAEKNALVGKSKVIGGEPYELVLCAPDKMRLFQEGNITTTDEFENISGNAWRCVFRPEKTGEFEWSVGFTPKHGASFEVD